MSTPAPTIAASVSVLLSDPLIGAAFRLFEQAAWLLWLGTAGVIASGLLPASPALRVRGLGAHERGGPIRAFARWLSVLAGIARGRLDAALGRVQARRRRAVVELCRVLAAELRAGRDPSGALAAAVPRLDSVSGRELASLGAAADNGHDVVPHLRALAAASGAHGLGYLAACWCVAADTGAGLAEVVERLAASLADEEALRRELSAHLAGPRATAVLLSVLPVFGLGMASALGNSPLAFLFTSPAGALCLVAGLMLDVVGLMWTHRMARSVLTEME